MHMTHTHASTHATLRPAEFVLPGHPDKLADAIADAIVHRAYLQESRALVGIEVALYRNVVFIDGRVACRASDALDFTQIARDVYADAGFGKVLDTTSQPKSTARGNAARPRYLPYQFDPSPKKLRVVTELCLGDLHIGEGEFREVADDQSIITGYACSLPGTDGLPVEHALVRTLAWQLDQLRKCEPELQLGPDGKLIVFVEESEGGRKFRLQSVSISIQHAASWNAVEARRAIERCVNDALHAFALRVPGFDVGDFTQPEINAAGEFIGGGPYGDNGLSGKKLVADFYGPRVPIGGGAMSGKDFWKVDRAGPLVARKIAIAAVERMGCRECTVMLGIRPGEREFRLLRVEAENRQALDVQRLSGLVDMRLASMSNWIDSCGALINVARWGHFVPLPPPRESSHAKSQLIPSVTAAACLHTV